MNYFTVTPADILRGIFGQLDKASLLAFCITSKSSLKCVWIVQKGSGGPVIPTFSMFIGLFGDVCNNCFTYNHVKDGGISKKCFCKRCGHDNYPHFFPRMQDATKAERFYYDARESKEIPTNAAIKRSIIHNRVMPLIAKTFKRDDCLPATPREIDYWIHTNRDMLEEIGLLNVSHHIIVMAERPPARVHGIAISNCIRHWYITRGKKLEIYFMACGIYQKDKREHPTMCDECNERVKEIENDEPLDMLLEHISWFDSAREHIY